ncbi:hypothetical protein B795N_11580 [Marinilactibacillus psychrotolerans]|nr:hypothetical protein B795N_11580 [Marinilactibacillus psychrotolerans]
MISDKTLNVSQSIVAVAMIGFILWQLVNSGNYGVTRWILYSIIIINATIALFKIKRATNNRE